MTNIQPGYLESHRSSFQPSPEVLVCQTEQAGRLIYIGNGHKDLKSATEPTLHVGLSAASVASYVAMFEDVDGSDPDNIDLHVEIRMLTRFLPVHRHPPSLHAIKTEDLVVIGLARELLSVGAFSKREPELLKRAASLLCARLADLVFERETSSGPRGFEMWQLEIIHAQLAEDAEEVSRIAMIADRCGLSVCHFSRLFKASFGSSFHQFRLKARINHAREKLAASDQSISQIALECGFADQSCLTRRFTGEMGISPGLWRRQNKLIATPASGGVPSPRLWAAT
ncbi:MAG: AraC family transcriptional regulator [Acidobacteriaceae bacterium]|nr:AraC family transcriptional regulator [Acidobacteriaceae bacterium]